MKITCGTDIIEIERIKTNNGGYGTSFLKIEFLQRQKSIL